MTDHWKDVQPYCDAGRYGWIVRWEAVEDARAKDAAEIDRLYALLDWALDAHAASKRREDILAQTLADVLPKVEP